MYVSSRSGVHPGEAEELDVRPRRRPIKYPANGLLPLQGMLAADQVNNPNSLNLQGDRIRHIIKRGFTANTTVGTVTRFMSFVFKCFATGNMESLELPVLSHENEAGTFSKGGDSGSLIVSALGEFVGLLTGGTNKGTDDSGSGSSCMRSSPVPTCILTTFRPSSPMWPRFVSFFCLYPIIPVTNDLYVEELQRVSRPWCFYDSFPLLYHPMLKFKVYIVRVKLSQSQITSRELQRL